MTLFFYNQTSVQKSASSNAVSAIQDRKIGKERKTQQSRKMGMNCFAKL